MHQTWKTHEIPEPMQSWTQGWQQYHPTWAYLFWTDSDFDLFVSSYYPQYLSCFRAWKHHIQRVDMIRYMWMHRFGGLYIDCDFECQRPMTELSVTRPIVLGFEEPQQCRRVYGQPRVASNAWMMSRVLDHPFWLEVLDECVRRQVRFPHDILRSTGPMMLTEVARQHSDQIQFLDWHILYSHVTFGPQPRVANRAEIFAIHHFANTWVKKKKIT